MRINLPHPSLMNLGTKDGIILLRMVCIIRVDSAKLVCCIFYKNVHHFIFQFWDVPQVWASSTWDSSLLSHVLQLGCNYVSTHHPLKPTPTLFPWSILHKK